MEQIDINKLLSTITAIVKETGFKSIEEFPKLYVAATKEDKKLEQVLERFEAAPSNPRRRSELASALAHYIELDDINMGLMAKAATDLK